MTRKPQIAWGLRIKTSRGYFIAPSSIRWLRKDVASDFWRDYENFSPATRAIVEQVQIIPVEGEDG